MNNRRTEQFYNKKYIESKTKETKGLDKNRKLTNKYDLKIKLVSTLIKSKNAFGLVLVGMNANIKKINVNKKVEEPKDVKRTIKKKKFKLTKLGKQVAAGFLTTTLLISTGTAIASTLDKTKTDIPVETTEMIEEYDDIFSNQENLAPIINETTPTVTEPEVTETEPTEEIMETEVNTPEETVVVATPTPEIIEESNPIIEETIPTQETVNYSFFEIPDSNINLEIGPSSTRNTSDDLLKYNTVRENYGDIIDQIAMETRWDPRLLTAMIAQENPFNRDQNYVYGITSIDGIHNGHTYPIAVFDENGNYSIRNITINVSEINSDPRAAIYAQVAILEDYLRFYDISNNGLEVFGSYNGGPATMYGNTLNEAFDNFRLSYQYPHDHDYYANIFYKLNALSFEGVNDLYFTNLNGETATFDITFTDEAGELHANYLNNANTL